MHHDVLALLDVHLAQLQAARARLAATRRVAPGERRDAVLHSIAACEEYIAAVHELLIESDADVPPWPDDADRGRSTVGSVAGKPRSGAMSQSTPIDADVGTGAFA